MQAFKDFAQDLSVREIAILTATHVPANIAAMKGEVADPAWKSKPTWYIVDGNDRATSPGLEASLAKKIGATTITVPSSHVIMLSKPRRVADVFLGAASTVNPK